jgi:hypothetical protein
MFKSFMRVGSERDVILAILPSRKGQPLSALMAVTGAAGVLDDTIEDRTGLTDTFDIDLDYVPQTAYVASKVFLQGRLSSLRWKISSV